MTATATVTAVALSRGKTGKKPSADKGSTSLAVC